jgi:hypothetical protein
VKQKTPPRPAFPTISAGPYHPNGRSRTSFGGEDGEEVEIEFGFWQNWQNHPIDIAIPP